MMVKTNQGSIRNRFKVALAEKETRDGRRYTYADILAATGVSTSTLTDWAQGKLNKIALPTLAALCNFFECQPGDLLEYVPASESLS